MFKTMISIMMTTMIASILMIICSVISKKSILDREKLSPFECGFDPKSSARMPFSMQFFMIAVIFLIFDIEIVIILPMIPTFQMSNMYLWFITSTMFTLILILGLYHEWKNGILEWTN